jgi:hypothetical protein
MKVVWSRAEGANNEPVALKSLMHWGRLVNFADDRFEVVDVEDPRVEIAVPSHHVEWVVIEGDLVDAVVLLDENREVALLIMGVQLGWPPNVTLGIRSTLE